MRWWGGDCRLDLMAVELRGRQLGACDIRTLVAVRAEIGLKVPMRCGETRRAVLFAHSFRAAGWIPPPISCIILIAGPTSWPVDFILRRVSVFA